jgi:hypothetical protein
MPVAAVISNKIFCAHGGISQQLPVNMPDISLVTLREQNQQDRKAPNERA